LLKGPVALNLAADAVCLAEVSDIVPIINAQGLQRIATDCASHIPALELEKGTLGLELLVLPSVEKRRGFPISAFEFPANPGFFLTLCNVSSIPKAGSSVHCRLFELKVAPGNIYH
jgi:hypothetical protein